MRVFLIVTSLTIAILGTGQHKAGSKAQDQGYAEVFPIDAADFCIQTIGSRDVLRLEAKRYTSDEADYLLLEVEQANRTKEIVRVMEMYVDTVSFELQVQVAGEWRSISFPDPWGAQGFRNLTEDDFIELYPGESRVRRIARRIPSNLRNAFRIRASHSLEYYSKAQEYVSYDEQSAWTVVPAVPR